MRQTKVAGSLARKAQTATNPSHKAGGGGGPEGADRAATLCHANLNKYVAG